MYSEGISLVSVKLYSFIQPLDQNNNTIFGSEIFVRGCMRLCSVQGKDICTSMGIIVKLLVHKCPQNFTRLIEYKLRFPCNLLHDCHVQAGSCFFLQAYVVLISMCQSLMSPKDACA